MSEAYGGSTTLTPGFVRSVVDLTSHTKKKKKSLKRGHHQPQILQQATAFISIFVDPSRTHLLTKASPGAFAIFLDVF